MPISNDPKLALDVIIRKSRVHFYKPIQIAEILYHHRTERKLNLEDLESYRNSSKKWRDDISILLVGRRSTSSQKYQDNVFETNAIPPRLLAKLGDINIEGKGAVEAYIYKALENRLSCVREVETYIDSATADTFSLKELVALFHMNPGLKRSMDKMYEILVYALFVTIVKALKAQITLEIINKDMEILSDFESFIKMVLGIDSKQTKIVMPAMLYRAGIANAADAGLDMWANFGTAIQVKHLTLTEDLVEDIVDNMTADRIVIVCLESERKMIEILLKQVELKQKLQGIITLNDLNEWYQLCLSPKHRKTLGGTLIHDLKREYNEEFPSSLQIKPFLSKRGYDKISTLKEWKYIK